MGGDPRDYWAANGKTGDRRKEADIKCLIKVGVTGAQSLWRTWGEMVALRIFQLKQKEAGVFIHYLPRSTAKSCFSGHLCFGCQRWPHRMEIHELSLKNNRC